MRGGIKFLALFGFLVFVAASCTIQDDEPEPQDTRTKLMNKTWYMLGKNGDVWVHYSQDGSWENSSGDEGSWSLPDSRTIKIRAKQDLLQSWEEDILEISGSSLETRVKGVSFSKKYSTAP